MRSTVKARAVLKSQNFIRMQDSFRRLLEKINNWILSRMVPYPLFLSRKDPIRLAIFGPVSFFSITNSLIFVCLFINNSFPDLGVHIRCPSLELESHDCIHELVEDISQGPPTRTLLRLQSLGTDYGSDEFGACTSSEETGQAKDDEPVMVT